MNNSKFNNRGSSDAVALMSGLTLALGCWFLALHAGTTELNQDEFQHIHIAWNTLQGRLLYRDFYEHHGPLTAWLGALVLKLRGASAASFETLLVFRWLNLVVLYGQLTMIVVLARRLSGSWFAGLAGAALVANSELVAWVGLQLHPDGLQNLLLLVSLWLLLERRDVAAGLTVGLLPAVHPKSLLGAAFVLAGVLAEIVVQRVAAGENRPWRYELRRVGLLFGGLLVVQLALAVFFAGAGGLGAYVQHAWVENFAGTVRASGSVAHVAASSRLKLWQSDPLLVCTMACGLVWAFVSTWRSRREAGADDRALVIATGLASLVSLVLPFRAYGLVLPMLLVSVSLGAGARWVVRGVPVLPALLTAAGLAAAWKGYQLMPPRAHHSTPMQRATLARVLSESGRDEPVFYVWPSRCAAYVFNEDPGYDWLLTTPDLFDVATPEKAETFRRVFDEKVVHGTVRYLAITESYVARLPPDARAYLTSRFTADGCLWTRR